MAATLTKPNWSSVTRTTASVQYSVTGYSLPSDETTKWSDTALATGATWTQIRTVTKYSNIKYKWDFGSTTASGTYNFSITAGQAKQISAKVTITCTKTVTRQTRTNTREYIEGTPAEGTPGEEGYKPATPGKWGNWQGWSSPSDLSSSTSTHTIASNVSTNTITVYGRPLEFSWGSGVATDKTIQVSAGLSATKWNTLVERTEQRTNWKNQSGGANYSTAEVSSGNLVRASTYNILANALGVSTVTGGSGGTIITAQVFINLQTAVNS